jgi:hypothetical protein|tara:strand:- start:560 stop:835 length:276 start_codon:yes stop_codon:yes gene_type:complete
VFLSSDILVKSNTGAGIRGFSLFNICITSVNEFTGITSMPETIEASNELSFGTKIRLKFCCFAHNAEGKTPQTFLNFPSNDNSPKNKESSI